MPYRTSIALGNRRIEVPKQVSERQRQLLEELKKTMAADPGDSRGGSKTGWF